MEPLLETEKDLEERLARPSDADVAAVSAVEGDVMILGAGGKMGPSLTSLIRRAIRQAGIRKRVTAVARFTNPAVKEQLLDIGVETINCDLLDNAALEALPETPNVIYMAARKFGTSDSEWLTWAMNTYLPARVAEHFKASRIVAFSTGNVYPLKRISSGGATEIDETGPVGEYAQSALGRERLLEYMSRRWNTPMAILRLNYAIDLRYGVLADIARAVYEQRPVDLRMSMVNVIWQGDANSICLRALQYCASPPAIFNVSGPETLSIRYLAEEFGRRFKVPPIFKGEEGETALLNNAAYSHQVLGYPSIGVRQLIDWSAHWIQSGGASLGKPTHFEVTDGKF